MRGWERDESHVLARPGTRGAAACPVPLHLHHVRDWSQMRRLVGGPVQIPTQALLVAAASFESPRPACGLLAAGVQQRLVSAAGLDAALVASPWVRHRAAMRRAIADIAQGAEALSEIDFVRLCRRAGLPRPAQQTVRRDRGGRRRYLDATWRRTDGRLVVVEADGALHLSQQRWWDDQSRQNDLVLGGAIVLRFPSVVVRTQPELVVRQLRGALQL